MRIGFGHACLTRQGFVDTNDKLRNVVQPGELRIIDHQAKQFTRGHRAVQFFVVAPLHVQQRLVQTQQRLPQCYQVLARRRIPRVALVRIQIPGFCHAVLAPDTIVQSDRSCPDLFSPADFCLHYKVIFDTPHVRKAVCPRGREIFVCGTPHSTLQGYIAVSHDDVDGRHGFDGIAR